MGMCSVLFKATKVCMSVSKLINGNVGFLLSFIEKNVESDHHFMFYHHDVMSWKPLSHPIVFSTKVNH